MNADNRRIRLSLDVSPDFFNIIEEMAENSCTTKSEILKRGIVLLQVALSEKANGNHLGVVNNKQKVVKDIVGL
jgi:hypothetical protein